MTTANLLIAAIDLVAIALLAFGIYYRRHRRRDLVVAFVGVNVGVLAVATVLEGSAAGIGLGLGLFGVLSIIRLRSTEISQREVAYYFAALAMGLIAGLGGQEVPIAAGLIALIVVVMWLADHPAAFSRDRQCIIKLDHAWGNDDQIGRALATVVGEDVLSWTVQQVDLVNDSTLVHVRYRASVQAGVAQDQVASPAVDSVLQ